MLRTIRGICIFLCTVLVVQGLALLLLTPGGLENIHPWFVRIHGEKFDPSTNTYAVYYETRTEVAQADLIVVGMDSRIAESYDLLGHFTRFVKQYNNYSDVILDLTSYQRMVSTSLFRQDEEESFNKRLDVMRDNTGMTEDFTDYFTELFIINRTMTDSRKFDILSYSETAAQNGSDRMTDTQYASAVADAMEKVERSAVCVVDHRLLEQDSTFKETLTSLLPEKKLMFLQTQYDKRTESPETHRSVDFPMTFGENGIYFVSDQKSDGFYRYYRKVSLIPGAQRRNEDSLDTRYTDYYFVVSGGTLAK